jgi:hypothetical protein
MSPLLDKSWTKTDNFIPAIQYRDSLARKRDGLARASGREAKCFRFYLPASIVGCGTSLFLVKYSSTALLSVQGLRRYVIDEQS